MGKRRNTQTVPGFSVPVVLGSDALRQILSVALDRVTFAEQRDTVLELALNRAGLAVVPDSAGELAAFVFGPFRDTVEDELGPSAVTLVLSNVSPALRQQCVLSPSLPPDQQAPPSDKAASQDSLPRNHRPTPSSFRSGTSSESESPRPPSSAPPRSTPSAPRQPAGALQLASGETAEGPVVVVADGDAIARAQAAQLLRSAGYGVVTAPDGHVALAMCMRRKPNAVLAASSMPAVGGRQLEALLSVAFATEAPPVVLLADAEEASEPGACSAVLVKPVQLEQLLEAVEPFLGPAPKK